MGYFYVVKTDGTVEKYKTGKKHLDLNDCYRAIGCEWVEMVNFKFGRKSYDMIVDEEGKLTNQPVNGIATMLYSNPYDCICGNAVVTKTPAWSPFTDVQAIEFENRLFLDFGVNVIVKEEN